MHTQLKSFRQIEHSLVRPILSRRVRHRGNSLAENGMSELELHRVGKARQHWGTTPDLICEPYVSEFNFHLSLPPLLRFEHIVMSITTITVIHIPLRASNRFFPRSLRHGSSFTYNHTMHAQGTWDLNRYVSFRVRIRFFA